MAEGVGKSDTISPRRRLLEEVLEERSKVVAGLPVDAQDPGPRSPLWALGATRLAIRARAGGGRAAVRDLCVLAVAWLESFGLPAEPGVVREDDLVG